VQVSDIVGRKTAIEQQHHGCPHRYATELFPLQFSPLPFGRTTDGSMRHETVSPFIGIGAKPSITSDP
jgi:hypothetical protein